jgi:branched-chain amino acid aminotransferase group I
MPEIVYLNGTLIPRHEAKISVSDYGFLYGYGLFETMRAYEGRVFRLDSHLSRLGRSAANLGFPVTALNLKAAVMDTVRANGLASARVRLAISIGEGSISPDPGTCKEPTVLILAGHYQPYPERVYQTGFRAMVSSIRRNSRSPLSRLKSASYLDNILARQEARETGADEALCLNEKDMLAEASMSNLFLVTGGILRTPALESGILAGVTRGVVLELAAQLGIKTLEQDIHPDELWAAEEAFLTNSLIEVMPLVEIGGKPVASGRPGSLTRRFMLAYRELVRQTPGES